MKNKKLLLCSILLIVGLIFKFNVTKNINEESLKPKGEKKNLLSMNLEQTTGAGDYKTVTQSEWPTDGYKFNSELSRCENGSKLSWDDTKKVVVVTGNLSDKCYVYFDIYQPTLAEYIKSQYTGTQGENEIYYHNSSLSNGAGDNSYRYAGSDYALTEKSLTLGYKTLVSTDSSATDALIVYLSNQTEGDIDYILGYGQHYYKFSDTINDAITNGYVTKNAISNYVCINSEEKCSDDNLFRIIGVFGNQVKLIKATSIGDMNWNNNQSNLWSNSTLNLHLNGEYLTSLGEFANKIATTTWKVGGNINTSIYDVTPTQIYINEVLSPQPGTYGNNETEYNGKIGLMYVSDYGFAGTPVIWARDLHYEWGHSELLMQNWLQELKWQWTMTRISNYFLYAYILSDYDKSIASGLSATCTVTSSYAIKPVFYLEPSVTYKSGLGTKDSPIIIGD